MFCSSKINGSEDNILDKFSFDQNFFQQLQVITDPLLNCPIERP